MEKASKPAVLFVEDDESLGFVVKDNLEVNGFDIHWLRDGEAAAEAFPKRAYDLCLIDVMLPKRDGFSLASHIRQRNKQVPIIFLTARSLKEDRIKGFKLGGDDYLTKPFSIEELVLRMEAILKRSQPRYQQVESSAFQIGRYAFDYEDLTLAFGAEKRQLTQREGDVLRKLAEKPGKLVNREELLVELWGGADYFKGRSLDVFITRLRKYLSEDPALRIANVHGVGYRLEGAVSDGE